MEGRYDFIIPENEPFDGYNDVHRTISYILPDNTIAGTIQYYLVNMTSDTWYISSFKVGIQKEKEFDTSLRKKGIGRNLFKRCVEDIQSKNGQKIEWYVEPIADQSVPVEQLVTIYEHIITKHIKPAHNGTLVYEKSPEAFSKAFNKMSYIFSDSSTLVTNMEKVS